MKSNRNKISPAGIEQYHRAVAYLETIAKIPQRRKRTQTLERFSYFLQLLGNPHKKISWIHVAGTSGKGSTAIMTHEIFVAAGVRCGLLVSPHTTTTIERIRVGTLLISPKEFCDCVDLLKSAIDRAALSNHGIPSYFELITAIAFIYFVKKKCTHGVLEVGMGGRLDATNVIPRPAVAIINKIDFDHTDILGSTLYEIATEKAGIIKKGGTVLVATNNHPSAISAIKKIAAQRSATVELVAPRHDYSLAMGGAHQQHNAALAARAATHLGVNAQTITVGLSHATLPCRFEIIQKKPLVILDGAHNRSKLESVVRQLDNLTFRKLYLIIALTHERQPRALFKKLSQRADTTIVTHFTNNSFKRSFAPAMLAALIPGKRKKIFHDPFDALDFALAAATSHDCIVITGSLYLTGQLRTRWRSEIDILSEQQS